MSILLLLFRILIAAALYAFIGWTIYTLWIEIYRRGLSQEKQSVPSLIIKVLR